MASECGPVRPLGCALNQGQGHIANLLLLLLTVAYYYIVLVNVLVLSLDVCVCGKVAGLMR